MDDQQAIQKLTIVPGNVEKQKNKLHFTETNKQM